MKLKFLIIAVLLAHVCGTWADEPGIPVAVFDFKTSEGELRPQGPKFTAIVTAQLSGDPRIVTVERAELGKALSEQALGLSGNVSAEAAAQIGHMTGAKVLVSGYLLKHGWGRGKNSHIMAIAYIVGTETGRLYTEKMESETYPTDVPSFAERFADAITTNIVKNITNLVTTLETREDRLKKIIATPKGDKRPVVLVNIGEHTSPGATNADVAVNIELGMVLQKAGFTVVDAKSERKPDVEITGVTDCDCGQKGGELFSCRATVAVKLQERVSGRIIAFERQESSAIDLGQQTAGKLARERATDELAARLIPLLAE